MWHMNLVAAGVKICMTGISSQVTVLSYNFYSRHMHAWNYYYETMYVKLLQHSIAVKARHIKKSPS